MSAGGVPVPEAAVVPSPNESAQVAMASSGSVLPDPSKATARGASPVVGATVSTAVGGTGSSPQDGPTQGPKSEIVAVVMAIASIRCRHDVLVRAIRPPWFASTECKSAGGLGQ